MTAITFVPGPRAFALCCLALAAGCALPPRATDELPPRAGTVDEHAAEAAERNRQERENRELTAYRAEQKRREEAEAAERRRAAEEQVRVTRLADLQKQKEADEARARAEAGARDAAAAQAREKVARARASQGKSADAPVDPAARLAQRRADPRWTRPAFSGLLCAARADRDRATSRLAAEKKKGERADAARLADAQRRVEAAEARSEKARAELQKLGLAPLGCKDRRTAEVAACFQAADAGKACKKGQGYVEVARSFGG
ncbi:MAG: hypothetical protein HZB56_19860 [Deltaproteobacteria bacterium]|nr:hypothetical protein [Deltaproteobacteria bacterium]